MISGTFAALLLAAPALLYLGRQAGDVDIGTRLRAEESALPVEEAGPVKKTGPRPSSRPYGVLIITGFPDDCRLLVDRVGYPVLTEGGSGGGTGSEIHLAAGSHVLEAVDADRRLVMRDTITVGVGEPTVYEFTRRTIQP